MTERRIVAFAASENRMKSDQKREQKWLMLRELVAWQRRPYDELRELIDQPQYVECQGPSGRMYLIQTLIYWDHKPGGAIRIIASIDDSGMPMLVPYCPMTYGTLVEKEEG